MSDMSDWASSVTSSADIQVVFFSDSSLLGSCERVNGPIFNLTTFGWGCVSSLIWF